MHECADLKKKSWLTFSEGSKMCFTENLVLSGCFLPAKITLFFLQGHVLSPYSQRNLPPTKSLKLPEMLKNILCNIPTRLQLF